MELGNIKVPNAHPTDPNPNFLDSLAFGVLWAFPYVVHIKIHLSFTNTEQDLIEIVKQLKQGLPLVYKEYEESVFPDPLTRTLQSITFLQCADFGLLRSLVWKYLAGQFAGGRIRIVIESDNLGKVVRY